jgi:mono/diheme cytochrome c family protein
MLRYFFLTFIVAIVCVLALAGLRYDPTARFINGSKSTLPPLQIFPDMKHQPKFQPQHPSTFFADGRAAREPIRGTVPIGYNVQGAYYQLSANNVSDTAGFSAEPNYFNTGKWEQGEFYGDGIPIEVNEKLLARGQQRFNINCAICHGAGAAGDGIIKRYGLVTIATLQDERIRTQPDGQIFATITNGRGTMGAYGPQIAVEDRWAIVAYLRVLQKSQNVKLAELPADVQKQLQSQP